MSTAESSRRESSPVGYLSIENSYRTPDIWQFKTLWALEKIHGTSAHIGWSAAGLRFFSGGEKQETFLALFNLVDLASSFLRLGHNQVTVYGEAYGGKCQGMKDTYGDKLKFVVFDVKVGETWLDVLNAQSVAIKLGLEFVHFQEVCTIAEIDAARDAPSTQAKRNGIVGDKMSEGVVLRPKTELIRSNGARVIAKHKRAEFQETKTPRSVDADKLKVLESAEAIATEWCTEMRLSHVTDKIKAARGTGAELTIADTGDVIKAMIADIKREAGVGDDMEVIVHGAEVVWSKDAERAIGKKVAALYKGRFMVVSEKIS